MNLPLIPLYVNEMTPVTVEYIIPTLSYLLVYILEN